MLGNMGQCHCLYHLYCQPWLQQLLSSVGTGYDPSSASHLPALLVPFQGFLTAPVSLLAMSSSHTVQTPVKLAGHPCSWSQPRMVLTTSPAPIAPRSHREIPPPAFGVLLPTLAAPRAPQEHLLALTPAVLGSQRFRSAQLQGAWTALC